ncbi:MAG: SIS domain-containing protein [FCB group bacterium]|jgi:D-sedoheptulose 7-phosphate isomerase|nr:SIS domain-containing protein [FCB group bacterium]
MLTWEQYVAGLTSALQRVDGKAVEALVQAIVKVHADDKFIYVCGNGGSAATASHIINDLVKAPAEASGCRPLRAVGLADCVSLMTALANDVEYKQMFSKQLEALGREGDLLIAISGSGNSPNIVEAINVAKAKGMVVVGLTGFAGGKMKDLCDIHINVPNTSFGQIEDAHLVIEHVMVEMLKEAFGGKCGAEIA